MRDTTGFEAAAGENQEFAREVIARLEERRPLEHPLSGHVDEVARDFPIAPIRRRSILMFLAGAGITGAFDKDSYTGSDMAGSLSADPGTYHVSRGFASNLLRLEYNDRLFDARADPNVASAGEQALHNSHHFMRAGLAQDLGRNIKDLEHALGCTEAAEARALILQRLIIDNNYLGQGRSAALPYAQMLAGLDISTAQGEFHGIVANRTMDVLGTATLNTMDLAGFRTFSSPDIDALEHSFTAADVSIEQTKEQSLRLALGGLKASIYARIQAKWMNRIRSASLSGAEGVALSNLRREWFEDVLFVTNGVEGHEAAAAMAEDFFYAICRIAFHAYACQDFNQTSELLDLYFNGAPYLGAHLERVRPNVIKRSAANIQWIKLLRVSLWISLDDRQRALAYYRELIRGFTVRAPANLAIQRAFSELGNEFGLTYRMFDDGRLSSFFSWASPVDNQLPYFHLIVPEEL